MRLGHTRRNSFVTDVRFGSLAEIVTRFQRMLKQVGSVIFNLVDGIPAIGTRPFITFGGWLLLQNSGHYPDVFRAEYLAQQ